MVSVEKLTLSNRDAFIQIVRRIQKPFCQLFVNSSEIYHLKIRNSLKNQCILFFIEMTGILTLL